MNINYLLKPHQDEDFGTWLDAFLMDSGHCPSDMGVLDDFPENIIASICYNIEVPGNEYQTEHSCPGYEGHHSCWEKVYEYLKTL
jgi:hypothetical protein